MNIFQAVKMRKTVVILPLLVILFFQFAFVSQTDAVSAQSSPNFPFVNEEFGNGTIVSPHSALKIWYDWVNVSGTQIINYAMYTDPHNPYPGPVANLVGQYLKLADGSEVFVASALDKFEVYRDLNGDGIPQGNFASAGSEILYYMFMNTSRSASPTPIQKTFVGDVPHYQWGFRYEDVYAYFLQPKPAGGVDTVAKLIFDHIIFSYDFSVNENVSNLKTNFDIGEVSNLDVPNSSNFSLNGLSLSLLYPTSTYASQRFSTSVNGQVYNPSTTENSTIVADNAQVIVGDVKAYEYVFGGNYALNRGENNETHQTDIQTYEAKTEVASISSLPVQFYGPSVRVFIFFRNELNLNGLFGGSWADINTDYSGSSMVYRVCFPVWDGLQIVHDPIYVGYISSSTNVPEFPILTIVAPILIVGGLLAVFVAKSRRHNLTT
jgi:hypothetical protein